MAINFNQQYCTGTKSIITIAGKEYLSQSSVRFTEYYENATYSSDAIVLHSDGTTFEKIQPYKAFKIIPDNTPVQRFWNAIQWYIPRRLHIMVHVFSGVTGDGTSLANHFRFWVTYNNGFSSRQVLIGQVSNGGNGGQMYWLDSPRNGSEVQGYYTLPNPWKNYLVVDLSGNVISRFRTLDEYSVRLTSGSVLSGDKTTILWINGKPIRLSNITKEQITVTCLNSQGLKPNQVRCTCNGKESIYERTSLGYKLISCK